MKLLLIRSPQLFFYMKSRKEDKEHDDGYNYSFIQLKLQMEGKLQES